MLKYIVLGLLLYSLSACKLSQNNRTTTKPKSSAFLFKKLEKNKLTFDWFAGKAKVKFVDENQKFSATVNIRIQKDSLIWIRIKKMNIEGIRIRITPHNIEVLDRQNSTYIQKDFASIQRDFGLDLTFTQLQNILVGNPIWYQNQKIVAAIEEQKNVLRTPKQSKEVLKIFFEANSFLLTEIRGSKNHDAIIIEYQDYQKVEKQNFAFRQSISLNSEKKGLLEINLIYSKVELNIPQKVKFVIPDSYIKQP